MLTHLSKYLHSHVTDDMLSRGKKIFHNKGVQLIEHNELYHQVIFRVKDDGNHVFHRVSIQKYNDPRLLSLQCGCSYNMSDICRHEAAAILQLLDMADKNMLGNRNVEYNQRHTVVKMKNIDLRTVKLLTSGKLFDEAENLLRSHKAIIHKASDERVEADLNIKGDAYTLVIQKNEERNFDTSCNCTETSHPLCEHKVLLFLQLLHAYGASYFDSIRNYDKEKNKLLQLYGYSLQDDLTGKFEFVYREGKPFLRVLDTNIKKVEIKPATEPLPKSMDVEPVTTKSTETNFPISNKAFKRPGIVFNFNQDFYPGFSIDAILGETTNEGMKYAGKVEALDFSKYVDTEGWIESDAQLLQSIRKMQKNEINKYVKRFSPFSMIWDSIMENDEAELADETRQHIAEFLLPRIQRLFIKYQDYPFLYILPDGKKFITANLHEINFSAEPIRPNFNV
jgi:non-specific serine/threonine protein kinase